MPVDRGKNQTNAPACALSDIHIFAALRELNTIDAIAGGHHETGNETTNAPALSVIFAGACKLTFVPTLVSNRFICSQSQQARASESSDLGIDGWGTHFSTPPTGKGQIKISW